MRGWFVGALVAAVVGCSKPDTSTKETPSGTPSAATPGPSLSAVQAELQAAQASTPPIEKLKADVRKLLPEVRQQLAAGKVKARGGDAICMRDLVTRQKRLHELRSSVLPKIETWSAWDEPQTDIAAKFDEVIVELVICVSCDERQGPRSCSQAARAIGELEKMLSTK